MTPATLCTCHPSVRHALPVDCVLWLARDRERLTAELGRLRHRLATLDTSPALALGVALERMQEVEDWLEDREEADYDEGQWRPNDQMHLNTQMKQAREQIERVMHALDPRTRAHEQGCRCPQCDPDWNSPQAIARDERRADVDAREGGQS